jgi:hypothetical protein
MTALGVEQAVDWVQSRWPKLRQGLIALALFLLISGISIFMLTDALHKGPTWYSDYGLTGMQYGARQVFPRAAEIARAEPDTTVFVSSTWANGSDVLLRYFADGLPNLQMGNINAWGLEHRPLDRQMLFMMTVEDLDHIYDSSKFTGIAIEETIPYPDGSIGFYFVRLEYVDDILNILEEERIARQALVEGQVLIDDLWVPVEHSVLDMNEIDQAFDGDPATLIRTLEANPLKIVLHFTEPIPFQGATLTIGGPPTRATVTAYLAGEKLDTAAQEVEQANITRELALNFAAPLTVDEIRIEVLSVNDGEISHVHLWEVVLE